LRRIAGGATAAAALLLTLAIGCGEGEMVFPGSAVNVETAAPLDCCKVFGIGLACSDTCIEATDHRDIGEGCACESATLR
jgi:hypothetical protein